MGPKGGDTGKEESPFLPPPEVWAGALKQRPPGENQAGIHLHTPHSILAGNPRRAENLASNLPPSTKNTHAEGQDRGKLFGGSDRPICAFRNAQEAPLHAPG